MNAAPRPRPRRLRQNVAPDLLRRIVEGRLKPGEKIIESRLSSELGVSRTPLREALLYLEREGLVRSDMRRGFTVEPLSARDVRETYPVLAHLECLAIRTSFDLLPLLIPELQRINSEFARARSSEKALELDSKWHDLLASQSKNSRLASLLRTLRLAIRRYEHLYLADRGLISTSVTQHRTIIRALRKRDLEALLKAVEVNYLFGMRVLLRRMGEE
ncbi:MAG TPA: GntR family transcriptional regulator [Candidatus Angelobacter sp.]